MYQARNIGYGIYIVMLDRKDVRPFLKIMAFTDPITKQRVFYVKSDVKGRFEPEFNSTADALLWIANNETTWR